MPNSSDVLYRARHLKDLGSSAGEPSFESLPPEIWLEVVSLACLDFPAVFSDSSVEDTVSFTRDVSGRCTLASYRDPLNARLALSHVCRAFREYAAQVVFEFLFIRHADQLVALASLFESQTTSTSRSFGWWTRRLELRLVDGGSSWNPSHTLALQTVFEHCSNASAFSAVLFSPLHLCQKIQPNLRRLELTCDLSMALRSISHLTPILETLWLTLTKRPPHNYQPVKLQFPRLHTLIFSHIYVPEITEEWDMPSLHTFITDDNSWSDQTIVENGEQMITQHGETIHRLGVITPIIFWTALHLCPNLVDLTVTCRAEGALFNQMLHYISYLFPFRCPTLQSITLEGCPIAVVNDTNLEKNLNALALAGHSLTSSVASSNGKVAEPLPLDRVRFAFVTSSDKLVEMLPEMVLAQESVGWRAFLNVCRARRIQLETSCGPDELISNVWQTVLPRAY